MTVLDCTTPTVQEGVGWRMLHREILIECKTCGTVRLYIEHKERFDQGNFGKRSLG